MALLADSGLRISEALRLRIEDAQFSERTLVVSGGKGGKDGTSFFGVETAQAIRAWLGMLRYAHLTKPDVFRKFRRASPLDNLRAGR